MSPAAPPPSSPRPTPAPALDLPESGPGAAAGAGARIAAFVVDAIASSLIAALFVGIARHGHGADRLPGSWSLIPFAVDYLVGVGLFGRTVGMNLFGLRLARVRSSAGRPVVSDEQRVDPWRLVIRLVLLALVIPAVVWDRNRRGLHDRVSETVVVYAGGPRPPRYA